MNIRKRQNLFPFFSILLFLSVIFKNISQLVGSRSREALHSDASSWKSRKSGANHGQKKSYGVCERDTGVRN